MSAGRQGRQGGCGDGYKDDAGAAPCVGEAGESSCGLEEAEWVSMIMGTSIC